MLVHTIKSESPLDTSNPIEGGKQLHTLQLSNFAKVHPQLQNFAEDVIIKFLFFKLAVSSLHS